jgi:acyl carrier protein phosphodiesterase
VNFLAHFHLAWPDEQLIAGGLEGDFYKGQLALDLIRLHRAIDAYTDQHRAVAGLRRQFPPQLRRFAGILIDLGFDHYLTQHWSLFSDLALERFNQQVYTILERHHIHLSAAARSMAGRLREYDVLGRYHSWDAVPASAARIGERFRRGNPLLATAAVLGPLRQPMEQAFLNFYPDLVRFSANQQGRCI